MLNNEASVLLGRHFETCPAESPVTIPQMIGAWLFDDTIPAHNAAASAAFAYHISCTESDLTASDASSVYSIRAKGRP